MIKNILLLIVSISLSLNAIIIDKGEFIIDYSEKYKGATKIIYTLDKKVNLNNIKNRNEFYKEPNLRHPIAITPEDYTNTGFDRGHIASDATFDYSEEVLNKTYSMANIVPQYPNVNREVWKDIEELERYNATIFDELHVENYIIYGNDILKKIPIEEIISNRNFKDNKHKENYIKKYNKDAKNLELKKIHLPTFFIKKMFNKKYNFAECFKVPNIKDIDTTNINKFKIDCNKI